MNYFDLHCDTAYEMYHQKQPLDTNTLGVNLDAFDIYDRKAQVFAVWSENTRRASDIYNDFFAIFENLKEQINKNSDRAVLCTDAETLLTEDPRLKIIPAVEGSRLLENDLFRVEALREQGVRILTLAWGGECPACGGYDTEMGLTDFGFRVAESCEKLGIILDVSHLSEKGFWDLANIATKPFIASHSNAWAICSHARNLSDTMLRTIVSKGGIVGVNAVGKHLSKTFAESVPESSEVVYDAVIKHIVHFLEKGSKNSVCFGCDFDGTEPLPGLQKASDLMKLAEAMRLNGADQQGIADIFYNNAFRFFGKNL